MAASTLAAKTIAAKTIAMITTTAKTIAAVMAVFGTTIVNIMAKRTKMGLVATKTTVAKGDHNYSRLVTSCQPSFSLHFLPVVERDYYVWLEHLTSPPLDAAANS
jgi:hypothetical protein